MNDSDTIDSKKMKLKEYRHEYYKEYYASRKNNGTYISRSESKWVKKSKELKEFCLNNKFPTYKDTEI